MSWYFEVLKKYAVFSGRSRRKEYWMFFLFNLIIALILDFIGGMTGITPEIEQSVGLGLMEIYWVAIILPSLTVGVRRLHDIGMSGWWMLLGIVPLFGAIVLIIMFAQDSKPGENKYGVNPKEAVFV